MFTRTLKLILAFAIFSLLLLFYFVQGTNKKSVPNNLVPQSQIASKASSGFPVRLKIPTINVNAAIVYVGLTPDGVMGAPSDVVDVGWFGLGPRPGERGSAVVDGHFNGENGEPGVFFDLDKLKEGDKLYVEDGDGTSTAFVVRESRTYDPGYADEVFSSTDSAHLNLITCDGVWDETKKSYSKRLVVFADLAN